MDIIHLINEKQLKLILNRQISLCFKSLKAIAVTDCDKNKLLACSVLFAQLIMQDTINCIAKNDDELDHLVANEALLLIAKLSAASFDDNRSAEVMRLHIRSKKLKGVPGVKSLQIWEIQYWLKLGTGLSADDVGKCMPMILTWLNAATEESFKYLSKMSPTVMDEQISGQLDFDFLDLDAPNKNDMGKKK